MTCKVQSLLSLVREAENTTELGEGFDGLVCASKKRESRKAAKERGGEEGGYL